MKSTSIFLWVFFAGIWIISYGCSSVLPVNLPVQNTLAQPQVHTTQLPQEIIPTPTLPPISTSDSPIIFNEEGPEFGVEIGDFNVDFAMIKALGAKWIRFNGILWSEIEPIEGEIHWDRLAAFEAGLLKAREAGLKTIVVVRSTPLWAQRRYATYCGQVLPEKFGAFGNFLSQLAWRYSPPPTDAHAWELWNEPDVDPSLVAGDSPFGCWGDHFDAFYGGGYYGEMLKAVAPFIRAADPSADIFLGGLLLDCDPTDAGSPGRCGLDHDLPPRFFEGVLNAGGGTSIDFLSFHGYPNNDSNMYSPVFSELNMPSWQARGGVVAGKANFLREIMTSYNMTVPLFLTETAFLCPEYQSQCNPIGPEFLNKQAEYGAWLVVRNYAENINTIWYPYNGPGWRNSAILDENQNPRPVYQSIQTALSKIKGSSIIRKVDEFSGVSGYELQSPQGHFYFLAPIAELPPQWTVPENAVQGIDVYGQAVSLESLSPLIAPVYIYLR